MANKTINELTQITSFLKNDQLAVYDVSENVTVKGQLKNVLKTPVEGLDTTAKNLIDAINELKQQIAALPPPITPQPVILKTNDVTFYDYNGTIVHSFTKEEFLALDSMPENPVHEGLVAQGWNYSLEDARDYVSKYGKLNIGQMYTTASGATEIDIELTEGRTTPTLGICPNGTVTVDWGDGSTDTVSGTSLTTLVNTRHAYASAGRYTIKLTTSDSFAIIGDTSYSSQLLWDQKAASFSTNRGYHNAIKAVRIGKNTSIGQNAFHGCMSLNSISIPNSVTSIGKQAFLYCTLLNSVTIPKNVISIGQQAFLSCFALNSISIPKSVTSIDQQAFHGCMSLSSVSIPESVTSIGIRGFSSCNSLSSVVIPESITRIDDSVFSSCFSLSSIVIPNSITSMGVYAFNDCLSMAGYHLKPTTPPMISSNTFNYIPSDCIIYIPRGSLAAYQSAQYWSTYASQMVEE